MNDSDFIAGFITGHSVRGCTGLSQVQKRFQQQSCIPIENWFAHNFPYHSTFVFPEHVPIVRASINNLLHLFRSSRRPFQDEHRDQISTLFAQYHTVILAAGSCGLQLLNNLLLPDEILNRVHVFGYGCVSTNRPQCASSLLVQGRNDLLSRLFHRRVDHVIECSHMDYLIHSETVELFNQFCIEVLKGASQ